jgi:hypothetical protein
MQTVPSFQAQSNPIKSVTREIQVDRERERERESGWWVAGREVEPPEWAIRDLTLLFAGRWREVPSSFSAPQ